MKQSEKINELAIALSKARTTFKPVEKDGTNPHFRSKYASLESIVKATEPSLTKNGLLLIQLPDMIDGKPVLVTTLIHTESGQSLSTYAPLLPVKQDSQSLGAAITYMKRYSWATIVGLPGTDIDDDGESERERQEEKKTPISAAQLAELRKFVNGDQKRMDNMLAWLKSKHKVTAIEDMPAKAYEGLRDGLEAQYLAQHKEEEKIHELAF